MGLAILAWRQHPTEIESDLIRFYRRRIGDWHRGSMTSRELLVLLKHLPDDSAYRRELSPTGWTEAEQMTAKTHEEFALWRASHYVNTPNEYAAVTFIAPKERLAIFLESEAIRQFEGRAIDGLMGALGSE